MANHTTPTNTPLDPAFAAWEHIQTPEPLGLIDWDAPEQDYCAELDEFAADLAALED